MIKINLILLFNILICYYTYLFYINIAIKKLSDIAILYSCYKNENNNNNNNYNNNNNNNNKNNFLFELYINIYFIIY